MQVPAWTVLSLHVTIIAFTITGLVLVPMGDWRHWRWVLGFWWRLAHLLVLVAAATQALTGRACFLTLWQPVLSGGRYAPSLDRQLDRLRDLLAALPLWFFTTPYTAAWL
ncbi:MAG: DUF2784 family protein [Gammaproteobacteria bacterium]